MNQSKYQVLVVEDDHQMQKHVIELLQSHGISCAGAHDGKEGLEAVLHGSFDLLILDVRLPGMDGIAICRRLKAVRPSLPIIMLSSLGDEIDRVVGLEIGADDYVVKPFSPRELLARVRARLRAVQLSVDSRSGDSSRIEIGGFMLDLFRRNASVDGRALDLTAKEFDVVALLAAHPGRPFTKEELLEEVWGIEGGDYGDSVTSMISRIRRKIETDPLCPVYLQTVRGIGYRFIEIHELDSEHSEDSPAEVGDSKRTSET